MCNSKPLSLMAICAVLCAAAPQAAFPTTWDKQFASQNRFRILADFDGQAVLDRETGLVWERGPDGDKIHIWADGVAACQGRIVGGRMGWRLPTVEELTSLVDPSRDHPALPAGHPFDILLTAYWTSTTVSDRPERAILVQIGGAGSLFQMFKFDPVGALAWCVRGGFGHDGQ